jgi:fermentation-respiration switch protein FrsA (DUF1100 family)
MHVCIISGLRSINSEPHSIANWRSPVLFIHGDEDRNVPFQQTTDLVEKLRAQNVAFEAIGATSAQHPEEYCRVAVTSKTAHTARQLRAPRETPARFAVCHFH